MKWLDEKMGERNLKTLGQTDHPNPDVRFLEIFACRRLFLPLIHIRYILPRGARTPLHTVEYFLVF